MLAAMPQTTPIAAQRLVALTFTAALLLLAWDASGLDLWLAQFSANSNGFPLRHHWLFTQVLHDGLRRLSWLLVLVLCLAVWWPNLPWTGSLAQLGVIQRLQLASTPLLAAFAVASLKSVSPTSCPWDLSLFGGIARYSSHWSWFADGGGGHCFPAGHASSGFAFLGGYFVFRHKQPRVAHAWLLLSALAGLLMGLAQQLRGAHFMSHTLWTAWLCWSVAFATDTFSRLYSRKANLI